MSIKLSFLLALKETTSDTSRNGHPFVQISRLCLSSNNEPRRPKTPTQSRIAQLALLPTFFVRILAPRRSALPDLFMHACQRLSCLSRPSPSPDSAIRIINTSDESRRLTTCATNTAPISPLTDTEGAFTGASWALLGLKLYFLRPQLC